MSDGIIALIVIGSCLAYLAIAGVTYAFIVETQDLDCMDVWHYFASSLWPIALPTMLATYVVRGAFRRSREAKLPCATQVSPRHGREEEIK